jgi:hypothetical protein
MRPKARYSSHGDGIPQMSSAAVGVGSLRSFSRAPWPGSSLWGQREDREDDERRLIALRRRREAARCSDLSAPILSRMSRSTKPSIDVAPQSILTSRNGVIGDHVRASTAKSAIARQKVRRSWVIGRRLRAPVAKPPRPPLNLGGVTRRANLLVEPLHSRHLDRQCGYKKDLGLGAYPTNRSGRILLPPRYRLQYTRATRYGTEGYPETTARRLQTLNITA